ncbi:MAG: hypothetical protein HZB19_01905 [Chloroflexi bacterium]|nr:hypothetical protein [Chloroflexota bacterium]
MKDLLYRSVSAGFQAFIWGGEIVDQEYLPKQGPAILVANHLGALGPIAVTASVPHRLHPWIASAMMDAKLAPEYLRLDFVEKEMHLPKPFSLWVATAISKVSVPLFKKLDCIPVFPCPDDFHLTFERSLDLLVQNAFLLIFPEDPDRPMDPRFGMRPFKKGFARLGEVYFQRTGRCLRFYPLAVHGETRYVQVGKRPITYNPYAPLANERVRIKNLLEMMIHEMILRKSGDSYLGVPLPH